MIIQPVIVLYLLAILLYGFTAYFFASLHGGNRNKRAWLIIGCVPAYLLGLWRQDSIRVIVLDLLPLNLGMALSLGAICEGLQFGLRGKRFGEARLFKASGTK
jgi:hypothetical protein